VPIRRPWHRGLPGAVLAGLIFVLGGYILRIYINVVSKHAYSYGALAAPIAALLFLFVLALAILLGAEFNATIESMWPAKPTRRERRKARASEQERREAEVRDLERHRAAQDRPRQQGPAQSPPFGSDS
jgi:membrane protein